MNLGWMAGAGTRVSGSTLASVLLAPVLLVVTVMLVLEILKALRRHEWKPAAMFTLNATLMGCSVVLAVLNLW
jgi:hypothetical protein